LGYKQVVGRSGRTGGIIFAGEDKMIKPLYAKDNRLIASLLAALFLVLFSCAGLRGFAAGDFMALNYSQGLDFAYHQYYDVPAWNCDGSLLLMRDAKGNAYLVKGTTAPTAPVLLSLAQKPTGYLQWDAVNPRTLYLISYISSQTWLYQIDVSTKDAKFLYKATGRYDLAPLHPDGDHLLLHPRVGAADPAIIYSVRTGTTQMVAMPGPVHRVRFTTHPDLSLFCNTETQPGESIAERRSYIINALTGRAALLFKGEASHPDWQPGGGIISFFQESSLYFLDRSGQKLKSVAGLNGHQSWSCDGRYIVAEIYDNNNANLNFRGWIVMINVANGQVIPIIKHQARSDKNQATHPHPHFSPDGTKIVFNSNHLGTTNPQVYVVDISAIVKR
jgi:hypothetical protein